MTTGTITVTDVSKRFRLERNRPSSLKEAILRVGKKKDVDDFWALRDINLDIEAASFFGLIGHNGSGKSTPSAPDGRHSSPHIGADQL